MNRLNRYSRETKMFLILFLVLFVANIYGGFVTSLAVFLGWLVGYSCYAFDERLL